VSLSTEQQQTGAIVVVKCAGRIVEGGESSALQHEIDRLLDEAPFVVLDLAAIDFIDSSGLGLLVRLLNRARLAGGDLRICAPSRRLAEILRVTRLEKILPPYESAASAIAATYDHARSTRTYDRLSADVLCVATSRDALVYVCEILRQAGFGVLSSDNLPDALMLLRAVRPKAVVIDAELRAARGTSTAEAFNTLADTHTVIELPADFSHRDAGEAAARLLDRVRSLIG
jgi:anti-sigma B factor antagonist